MGNPPTAPHLTQCPICQTTMKSYTLTYRHRCPVSLCGPGDRPDLVVRDSLEVRELIEFRSVYTAIKTASTTGIAVPGVAPLFFPANGSLLPPVLRYLGCVDQSYDLLLIAALEAPVKLRKNLKIQHGDTVYHIKQNLVPTTQYQLKRRKLKMIDKNNYVIIHHMSQSQQVSYIHTF